LRSRIPSPTRFPREKPPLENRTQGVRRIDDRVAGLEKRTTRLEHIVVGNGKVGLAETVRTTIARVDDLNAFSHDLREVANKVRDTVSQVDALAKVSEELKAVANALESERQREKSEREGARRVIAQARAVGLAILALIGVGGTLGFNRVLDAIAILNGR